jgi:hypothetical protein
VEPRRRSSVSCWHWLCLRQRRRHSMLSRLAAWAKPHSHNRECVGRVVCILHVVCDALRCVCGRAVARSRVDRHCVWPRHGFAARAQLSAVGRSRSCSARKISWQARRHGLGRIAGPSADKGAMQTPLYTFTHTHAHTHTRARTHTHTHARAHTHTHTNVHARTNTHTRRLRASHLHVRCGVRWTVLAWTRPTCRSRRPRGRRTTQSRAEPTQLSPTSASLSLPRALQPRGSSHFS